MSVSFNIGSTFYGDRESVSGGLTALLGLVDDPDHQCGDQGYDHHPEEQRKTACRTNHRPSWSRSSSVPWCPSCHLHRGPRRTTGRQSPLPRLPGESSSPRSWPSNTSFHII